METLNEIKDNQIYNFTTVVDVKKEGETFNVYTDRGIINAKYVVLATHYPIINAPGFHFLKMYQSTSYIIAIETNSKLPQGMYINDKPPIYSFRTARYNDKDILLIGGSDHKTGEPIPDNSKYEDLVQSILALRKKSDEEIASLYKADEHTYVNAVYEWEDYTCKLLATRN